MQLTLRNPGYGVVVRPRRAGPPQTLLFLKDEVAELLGGDSAGLEPLRLGPPLAFTDAAADNNAAYSIGEAHCPVYDAASKCVYFVHGWRVMRLDADNSVSLVAGANESGREDGRGPDARFNDVRALTTDGRGCLYLAEIGRIRKIAVAGVPSPPSTTGNEVRPGGRKRKNANANGSSAAAAAATAAAAPLPADQCVVTTLQLSIFFSANQLSYDALTEALVLISRTAVCKVAIPRDGAGAAAVAAGGRLNIELFAGDWDRLGKADGAGEAARFTNLRQVLTDADGSIYVLDQGDLRKIDSDGHVSTMSCGAMWDRADYWGLLPSGFLAVGSGRQLTLHGGDFTLRHRGGDSGGNNAGSVAGGDSDAAAAAGDGRGKERQRRQQPQPQQQVVEKEDNSTDAKPHLLKYLYSQPAGEQAGSSSTTTTSGFLTIHVGDKSFLAHRALLADSSEYFQQLLTGGFGDSAAAETSLPNADPEAFAQLLGYMYGWISLEDMPEELLRPVVELTGRLLMPEAQRRLKTRLLAACCTPETVVADLLWADRHNLSELVPHLVSYFVRHSGLVQRANAGCGVRELVAGGSQELTVQVMQAMMGKRG